MLSPELETRAFLGRPVVDIYGRSLGRVIGIERNAFGELEEVQVEAAGGLIDRFQFPVRCKCDDLWREPQLSRLCANDEPSRGLDLDLLEFSEGVSFDSDYSPEASTVDVYYWTSEKGSGFELRGEHD